MRTKLPELLVKVKGKNKMSVLNAVKNKLLARVVAVVNKQQEYVKKSA